MKRVLHVDDDDDIREITRIALEVVSGLEVKQCSSGVEALKVAGQFRPDVILMDVMMPELGGVDTCARFKTMPDLAHVPVIYMTAKAQSRETRELLTTGAIGVITKPFDPMTLADQMQALISANAG